MKYTFEEIHRIHFQNGIRLFVRIPNAFIGCLMHRYQIGWLNKVTGAKINFPDCYLRIRMTSHRVFYIWATTEMEAFRTLYEMTLYSDFGSSLEKFGMTMIPISIPK